MDLTLEITCYLTHKTVKTFTKLGSKQINGQMGTARAVQKLYMYVAPYMIRFELIHGRARMGLAINLYNMGRFV